MSLARRIYSPSTVTKSKMGLKQRRSIKERQKNLTLSPSQPLAHFQVLLRRTFFSPAISLDHYRLQPLFPARQPKPVQTRFAHDEAAWRVLYNSGPHMRVRKMYLAEHEMCWVQTAKLSTTGMGLDLLATDSEEQFSGRNWWLRLSPIELGPEARREIWR